MKEFPSALAASSNQAPGGGDLYPPLRKAIIETAIAQGYDPKTMYEKALDWAYDLDTFGHVKNSDYGKFSSGCGLRVFHSFEAQLKGEYEDFMKARRIGVLVKSFPTGLFRQVKFPNSLVAASHATDVLPDRYHSITRIWSLRQQAVVAELVGWVVFFDHQKGKVANLLEVGGVWSDLYHALVERKEREGKIAEQWEKYHSRKQKAMM